MNDWPKSCNRTLIADFKYDDSLLDATDWFFVVKSQDQSERRARLLGGMKDGKYGRTTSRPTSIGLLVNASLVGGECRVNWQKEFQEPRHIIRLTENQLALTDVNGVNLIDDRGVVSDRLSDELYAFLHSIDHHGVDRDRVLVCSSGYDAVIETNLRNGQRRFLWSAWEHGFNPDEDGNWLSLTERHYVSLKSEGKAAVLITPSEYGEQGIDTKYRSAHPNVAVYNPYTDFMSMIVSIGHGGTLYEVDLRDFSTSLVLDQLDEMPHGLLPFDGGWVITNTTAGEIWILEKDLTPKEIISLRELPGKPPGLCDIEWVQNTKITPEGVFLSLDANRGLIAFDLKHQAYQVFQPDPKWCLQDALLLER